MAPPLAWTDWNLLPDFPAISEKTLSELLDGGQAFRWHRGADGEWTGIWADHVVRLQRRKDRIYWQTLATARARETAAALKAYLGIADAHERALDALPWRSDLHLSACMAEFPGLRLLRQPFGETLLCFLCSATKQIVQIKQIVALLAERHGRALAPGFHRLPTWDELAHVCESALRECLLGFRARYIHETARFLADHPGWLHETETMAYPEAKARLCLLPGVGEKVSDCVLLFGAGLWEAFPVDVWIIKTMALRYGLEGWRPTQIAHFGRVHFGNAAGLAQQYLFAWERRHAREPRARSGA